MTTPTREIHLASRPSGTPTQESFRLVETVLPDPGAGEVVVRNTHLSVDPYMRGRMNDVKSYVPPFRLDAPLDGGAVGEVLASGADGLPLRATSSCTWLGWREHALLPAAALRKVDVSAVPASAYLGVLGVTGHTAYVGLTTIADVREGDTVFVSGAAGAVGSVAGQVARRLGAAKVIGSAGATRRSPGSSTSSASTRPSTTRPPRWPASSSEHGPVDVYFDNVGGDHLEAAILHLADFGADRGVRGHRAATTTRGRPPVPATS